MTPTATINRKHLTPNEDNKRRNDKPFDSEPKLYKFDNHGKIYVPSFIRRLFHGYRFAVYVESGKIVLDPVEIEEEDDEPDNAPSQEVIRK